MTRAENIAFEDDDYEDDEDTMEDLYLTFALGERDYGIDICNVVEIVVLQTLTQIPDMPAFVKGIINLRGKVIPLLDVRERFKLPHKEYYDRTCVIIIEVERLLVGLIVDMVSEVIKIAKDQIEAAPKIGDSYSSRFVDKIGKVGEAVKIILNLPRLLNEKELEQIVEAQEASTQSEEKQRELAVK